MPTDPTREKWERRRAARRAQPAQEPPPEAERPWCVDRSFIFWMFIGVPTAIFLIGIVIILAAINMRAGYRGARVMLTVIAVFVLGAFTAPLVLLVGAVATGNLFPLLWLVPHAVTITATVLMWRPEASAYYRAVRGA